VVFYLAGIMVRMHYLYSAKVVKNPNANNCQNKHGKRGNRQNSSLWRAMTGWCCWYKCPAVGRGIYYNGLVGAVDGAASCQPVPPTPSQKRLEPVAMDNQTTMYIRPRPISHQLSRMLVQQQDAVKYLSQCLYSTTEISIHCLCDVYDI